MNLDVKKMKLTDPARIDKSITILNGLGAADLHLRQTIGLERDGGDDYTPVKPHHVQLIVDMFKRKVGVNTDENLTQQPKTRNPFAVPDGRRSMSKTLRVYGALQMRTWQTKQNSKP